MRAFAVTKSWVLALSALVALAVPAGAGPWPREPGAHFLSVSVDRDRDGNQYSALYGEYGLTPRYTLGYELGHSNAGESSAIFWLQRAMGRGDGANRLSMSVGVGAIRRGDETLPVGQVVSGWGRGFDGIWDGGWITAELKMKVTARSKDDPVVTQAVGTLAALTPEFSTKADLTLGLRRNSSLMIINQLRLEKPQDEDLTASLASSVVRDLVGSTKIELGVVTPISGPVEPAVRLGTWLEF